MSDMNNYITQSDTVKKIIDKPHFYKITNLINNKYYYGVHSGNNTDLYLGSGKLLHQAYKKYGIDNFKKEILLQFESITEAFEYEKIIVNENMINKNNPMCYNICIGGNGGDKFTCLSNEQQNEIRKKISYKNKIRSKDFKLKISLKNKGKKISEDIKQKISKTMKGRKLSDETKQKIREGIINKKNLMTEVVKQKISQSMTGKKHSDEIKQKMSDSQKGKPKLKFFCPYNNLIIYPPNQMSRYIKKYYPHEKQWNEYTREEKIEFLYVDKNINGPCEN